MIFVASRLTAWMDRLRGPAAAGLPVGLSRSGRGRAERQSALLAGIDKTLVWVALTLILWGLVMVYSASVAMPGPA